MIIDSDYQTLTIKTHDNQILIRNIDDYNMLKYKDFNGKRIIKDFGNVNITETFNDGIFNLQWNDTKLQVRDKNEIAKRIKYCIDNNVTFPLEELLLNEVKDSIKEGILTSWLVPFGDRLSMSNDEVIIDDVFKVDKNGSAHYKNNGEWHFLCIVVPNSGKVRKIIKHELGDVKIDFKTMEIYNKVLFLLFPNINDKVFYNQLPKKLKTIIKDNLVKMI